MPMLYDEVGGSEFFVRLVDLFYEGVVQDDVLWPLYPDHDDLAGARERLTLFLIQYWGGPTTYSDERGHPRLRQRHFPFAIGELERDRWMLHMQAAVDECATDPIIHAQLTEYMSNAAQHMINR
jgi:hemoglobin